jgi:hypothetical protein
MEDHMQYFRMDNTEGFSQSELDILNRRVAYLLDGNDDPDAIKNACDQASNEFAANEI